MIARRVVGGFLLAVFLCGMAMGSRRWAEYEQEMQTPTDDPPDAGERAEFAFARLRYRSFRNRGFYQRWGIDANKSDRLFLQGLRRLTRIDARSIEEIIDVDSDAMFYWPWLYAVSVGDWVISDSQVARLREYLLRGGFLMVDDFHGEREWATFESVMTRVLPDHRIVEIDDRHPMFQMVYDLSHRTRVPGYNVVYSGQVERGGIDPHWRGMVDSDGVVKVAICFNMDLGDAWEFADDPGYPEMYASMAYRMGVNYILYAMTH